jgi:hypothetical protein
MPTYAEMKFNAENHLNPVNLIWDKYGCNGEDDEDYKDDGIDECGDEWFNTYEEALDYVEKHMEDSNIQYLWKIVDAETHKTIENNEDWSDEFYQDDEELIEEYRQELKHKRKEEKVIRKIAISKIKRNAIYNNGLGLKLAIKAYSKDF